MEFFSNRLKVKLLNIFFFINIEKLLSAELGTLIFLKNLSWKKITHDYDTILPNYFIVLYIVEHYEL